MVRPTVEFRNLLPGFSRYVLTMQYFGPSFCGWQMQSTGVPLTLKGKSQKPSLDGVINEALMGFAGEGNFMNLKISSRTDAGVHALRNTFQVDLKPRKSNLSMQSYCSSNVLNGLNYHLQRHTVKDSIRVREVSHCRFGALRLGDGCPDNEPSFFFDVKSMASSRTYSYRIFCDRPVGGYRDAEQSGSVHSRVGSLNLSNDGEPGASDMWAGGAAVGGRSGLAYCGGGSSRLYKPDAADLQHLARAGGRADHSPSIFSAQTAWVVPTVLEVASMQRAADLLVGVHDFTTFRSARCDSVTPFRDVMEIRVERLQGAVGVSGVSPSDSLLREQLLLDHRDLVVVTITASSFVRRMVRNIVSALVHVGRGQVPPSHVGELLQMRDREQLTREGCEPAPAHGLYLMNVNYDLSAKELQERKKQWRAMYK